MNVILSPAKVVTREQIRAEFGGAGAEVTFGDNVKISGIDSIHVMGNFTNKGLDYFIEQFYPTAADGQVYVVTFSFSRTVSAQERSKVIDETLSSWTWTI
ncbi:hypothetical protein ASG90_00840 [Nocardioides sp. Soil797]|nr:hypothetical protein ASG90_00840 [Nocardioides sp. Soil797]